MASVGQAFNILAGRQHQAPQWMREHGLEWLFRLFQEPRRLWRRYLVIMARNFPSTSRLTPAGKGLVTSEEPQQRIREKQPPPLFLKSIEINLKLFVFIYFARLSSRGRFCARYSHRGFTRIPIQGCTLWTQNPVATRLKSPSQLEPPARVQAEESVSCARALALMVRR